VLLEFEFVVYLLIAKRTASLQFVSTFVFVFLLLLEMNNFKAVVTVLKVMLLTALFDVMLEELRDFYVLMAVVAGSNELTLFSEV
jgi:hypothetical protein